LGVRRDGLVVYRVKNAAVSAASPLAQALLGACVTDTVELERLGGAEELTVVTIDWPI